jgi:signal transduction histidine kinase
MSLASILLGWVVAGRALRPLRTITKATREISATNLHRRLALHGPQDEVKDLGDTIDALLIRLEDSFQAQRAFVANASHELRTPLTLSRAMLQFALADPSSPSSPSKQPAPRSWMPAPITTNFSKRSSPSPAASEASNILRRSTSRRSPKASLTLITRGRPTMASQLTQASNQRPSSVIPDSRASPVWTPTTGAPPAPDLKRSHPGRERGVMK